MSFIALESINPLLKTYQEYLKEIADRLTNAVDKTTQVHKKNIVDVAHFFAEVHTSISEEVNQHINSIKTYEEELAKYCSTQRESKVKLQSTIDNQADPNILQKLDEHIDVAVKFQASVQDYSSCLSSFASQEKIVNEKASRVIELCVNETTKDCTDALVEFNAVNQLKDMTICPEQEESAASFMLQYEQSKASLDEALELAKKKIQPLQSASDSTTDNSYAATLISLPCAITSGLLVSCGVQEMRQKNHRKGVSLIASGVAMLAIPFILETTGVIGTVPSLGMLGVSLSAFATHFYFANRKVVKVE